MILADVAGDRRPPDLGGERGACPMCDAEVVGKCGSIVAHHWAHVARPDCDTWATESGWHIAWKQYLHEHLAAAIEVPMERHGARHRADAVIGRLIVELQATYLPPSANGPTSRDHRWAGTTPGFPPTNQHRTRRRERQRRPSGHPNICGSVAGT